MSSDLALPHLKPLSLEIGAPALEDISTWIGLVAPAGAPKAIVDKIRNDVAAIYSDRDFVERMLKAGINAVSSTPEDMAKFTASETARWGKVIRETGIEIN